MTAIPGTGGQPVVEMLYSADIEAELTQLTTAIQHVPVLAVRYPSRWLAIQLLEGDAALLDEVRGVEGGAALVQTLEASMERLRATYGNDVDVTLTDYRYSFVNSLVHDVVTRTREQSSI